MASLTVYKKYLTITAIAWVACLLPFVAAYMILLKPQITSKRQLDKKLLVKEQERQTAEKAAEEPAKIELNEQIARLRERLGDFVTDSENAADLTFDITQVAREKEVASLSVGSDKKTRMLKETISDSNSIDESCIEVSFVSGFNQFASFVNSLERHRPVFFVHAFKMARSTRDDSVYTVTLDVRALVRKQQETEISSILSARLYSVKE